MQGFQPDRDPTQNFCLEYNGTVWKVSRQDKSDGALIVNMLVLTLALLMIHMVECILGLIMHKKTPSANGYVKIHKDS